MDRDQDMAQRGSEVAGLAGPDDPYPITVGERFDGGRRVGRNQNGDVHLGFTLIIAQFGKPDFLPFAVLKHGFH